jgi:hypothetical protein
MLKKPLISHEQTSFAVLGEEHDVGDVLEKPIERPTQMEFLQVSLEWFHGEKILFLATNSTS